MRPDLGPPPPDQLVAALAGRQHGVVSRAQLREIGLSDAGVARRAAAGRLHRIHRGVYAVGHRVLSRHGHWMAAVLASGPAAVLSHASAAALWEVRGSAATVIDITTRRSGRVGSGLRIHRPRTLRPDETTTRDGIPTTTPARTILDVAALLAPRRLDHLLVQTEIRELADHPTLEAMARAHPGHHGAGRLLAALNRYAPSSINAKSGLERLLLALCSQHGLPTPRVNHRVEGKEVDFLFEDARLVVETDSWTYHKTRHAVENDRARDAHLARAGYRTLRFTDRQLERDAATVAQTVATALSPTGRR